MPAAMLARWVALTRSAFAGECRSQRRDERVSCARYVGDCLHPRRQVEDGQAPTQQCQAVLRTGDEDGLAGGSIQDDPRRCLGAVVVRSIHASCPRHFLSVRRQDGDVSVGLEGGSLGICDHRPASRAGDVDHHPQHSIAQDPFGVIGEHDDVAFGQCPLEPPRHLGRTVVVERIDGFVVYPQ